MGEGRGVVRRPAEGMKCCSTNASEGINPEIEWLWPPAWNERHRFSVNDFSILLTSLKISL